MIVETTELTHQMLRIMELDNFVGELDYYT